MNVITKELHVVIYKHYRRRVQITNFYANPELDKQGFYDFLTSGTLQICSRDKHFWPIERDSYTLQDRARCAVHYLPYKCTPN